MDPVLESFELAELSQTYSAESQQPSLPPADGGKDAWLYLATAFLMEALIWGFAFSFGVFQTYYSKHALFASDDASNIAVIGTTSTGLLYLSAPLVYVMLKKYPEYRRLCSLCGFVLVLAAVIASSFAQSVTQLIITQGLLYGIGGAIHYYPALAYLDEWFIYRRGMAFGVVCAGAGAAGVVIPLTMQWVLDKYGFRTALRLWAIVFVVLSIPGIFFMKGRIPIRVRTGPRRMDLGFLQSKAFWTLGVATIVQGLGYFMPSIYMPSFALSVGLSTLDGTIAIALLNASAMVGAMLLGVLSDRFHVTTAFLVSSCGSVVAVFCLWSFAVNTGVLFLFAILYGVFAGGFSSTWASCVKPIREQGHPGTDAGMIIAVLSAGKGVGSVISGPLSEAILNADKWKGSAGFAFGSGYGGTIILTGVTAAFTSLGWCGRRWGLV